jgi:hypothetical protein
VVVETQADADEEDILDKLSFSETGETDGNLSN